MVCDYVFCLSFSNEVFPPLFLYFSFVVFSFSFMLFFCFLSYLSYLSCPTSFFIVFPTFHYRPVSLSSPISYLLAAALSLLTKSWSALIDHCGSFSLSSAGAPGCVLLEGAAEPLHTSITGQNGAGQAHTHTHTRTHTQTHTHTHTHTRCLCDGCVFVYVCVGVKESDRITKNNCP